MSSSVRWLVSLAFLASVPSFGRFVASVGESPSHVGEGQDSPPCYVAAAAPLTPLLALPIAEGSPRLAELLEGTAMRELERRAGFVRVRLEGWVAEAGVAAIAAPPDGEGAAPRPPGSKPVVREPVADLALAHHVGVAAVVSGAVGAEVLVITLELVTLNDQPVVVVGSKHAGTVRIYEQKRIPGGRSRGDERFVGDVIFTAGRATLEVPLSSLSEPLPALVLVSARAELSATRTLVGAATDVALVIHPGR